MSLGSIAGNATIDHVTALWHNGRMAGSGRHLNYRDLNDGAKSLGELVWGASDGTPAVAKDEEGYIWAVSIAGGTLAVRVGQVRDGRFVPEKFPHR